VSNATPAMASTSAVTICSGGIMDIANATSNASSFFWDFGDLTTQADTSRLARPTYTYPDTGTYVVMLVVEPHSACADTSYAQVALYDLVQTSYTYQGELCFASHSVDLINTSNYSKDATFSWDFGGNTNIGRTSTLESPTNVIWDQIGAYYVELTVKDFGCTGVFGDTLFIYPNPVAYEKIKRARACLPYTVQLFDSSYVFGPAQHFWDFGDGYTANDVNPIHTYTEPGTYTVTHAIRSLVGCLDSSFSIHRDIITVLPVPTSALEVSPRVRNIYNPIFTISNNSSDYTRTLTILPNDEVIENLGSMSFTVQDTGIFSVYHISENEYGCTDTVIELIEVFSPFNLFMPNAFTPDGDGINDEYSYTITGVEYSYLEIYNRWGEVVFKSDDPYEKWNGLIHNHGEPAEAGIYTYVLKAEVERGAYTHKKIGVINLVR